MKLPGIEVKNIVIETYDTYVKFKNVQICDFCDFVAMEKEHVTYNKSRGLENTREIVT